MAAVLSAFLSRAAARGFSWGRHDCVLFAADWVLALTGQDPATAWRGAYATEAEAREFVARGGGLAPMIHRAIAPLGWIGVTTCAPGDVAVVPSLARDGPTLAVAIFAGHGKFAKLTARGLLYEPAEPTMGWRLAHG